LGVYHQTLKRFWIVEGKTLDIVNVEVHASVPLQRRYERYLVKITLFIDLFEKAFSF